jgi:ABC-type glycerol-3-phosphate transport system substrate-binding protein
MKKFIITILAILMLTATLTACGNRQLFDTTYKFDRAIISLPNGDVIDGKIDSWIDYEDGDQIQVKINGTTYLVHSSNIVLIAE